MLDVSALVLGAKPAAILWAAALLGVERLTYAAVWRAPNAFRRWSEKRSSGRSAIDTLATLFAAFKVLQVGVFVGWCAAHGGGSVAPHSWDAGVLAAGTLLIAIGQSLNLAVFRALGKVGVFYGNRLGHYVPWRQTFPFTWLDHPQYVGTVLSIWGFFVLMRFPARDWLFLPVLETVYYAIGIWLERDDIPTDRRHAGARN